MKNLELFDSAGVDLRPQIRELRDDKKRDYLGNSPVWKMTLYEYCEMQVCTWPFDTLSDEEIINISVNIFFNGYTHLKKEDPLETHIKNVKDQIDDKVELYKETDGRYGKGGKFFYRRVVEDAFRLGLDIPEKVLTQSMFDNLGEQKR